MLVLGLDFETSGLDFATSRIIEVGAVMYSTEEQKPLQFFAKYVKHKNLDLSPEIIALTGIKPEHLQKFGEPEKEVMQDLATLAKHAAFIVAHNGKDFDRPMWSATMERLGLPMPETPWLDTLCDVPYPASMQTRKLPYLAAEHGFLNPFSHRAIFDVLTTLKVLSQYDFATVVSYAALPSVTLQIFCPPPWEDGGEGNRKAKELGFRYDGATKRWLKVVKEPQQASETSAASPYKVEKVG